MGKSPGLGQGGIGGGGGLTGTSLFVVVSVEVSLLLVSIFGVVGWGVSSISYGL